jgi:endonuclease/exonuclease/phosphatase family metal-dependent hydrolase
VPFRAITWNLFHGRDFPPDRALFTPRSRLFRITERNATHVQVNRDIFPSFAEILSRAEWDVALLQEAPPRWSERLAHACDAEGHRVLTSRNWLLPITSALATFNPDLIASWEGGSNLTLVREHAIAERRTYVLRPFLPERRTMAFTRLGDGTCIANLHASTTNRFAEDEVRRAAATALEWAHGGPLLLGGDFNLRPRESRIFDELEHSGFSSSTGPGAIDHLLAHGMEVIERPEPREPEGRELPYEGLRLRPSDHSPVEGGFLALGA